MQPSPHYSCFIPPRVASKYKKYNGTLGIAAFILPSPNPHTAIIPETRTNDIVSRCILINKL